LGGRTAVTDLASAVLDACRARGWRIATAESCTGGLIASALTAIAGSSDVVECGYVTYSNAAKAAMLGVDPALIVAYGAGTQIAVSVTGVAGPGGGSADKPVGTVWFGLALAGSVTTERVTFPGDRDAVRAATVVHALRLLQAAARAA